MTARLFPDYAATPTATERKQARTDNARQQISMFTESCDNCGHPAHDNQRCVGSTDNGDWCACSWPDPGNYTDTDPTPPHGIPRPCPVCAGDHLEADCTHGTAPTLPTRNPSNPAQVRAMFASLGWAVTK